MYTCVYEWWTTYPYRWIWIHSFSVNRIIYSITFDDFHVPSIVLHGKHLLLTDFVTPFPYSHVFMSLPSQSILHLVYPVSCGMLDPLSSLMIIFRFNYLICHSISIPLLPIFTPTTITPNNISRVISTIAMINWLYEVSIANLISVVDITRCRR